VDAIIRVYIKDYGLQLIERNEGIKDIFDEPSKDFNIRDIHKFIIF
jgi:hypothetical protein